MLVDIIEHFEMNVGYKLIDDLKQDFNKILLMLPEGKHPQEKDVTGFDAHEYQKHRSFWYVKDIEKLEFTENYLDENFHTEPGKDSGCYFGVWEKIKK